MSRSKLFQFAAAALVTGPILTGCGDEPFVCDPDGDGGAELVNIETEERKPFTGEVQFEKGVCVQHRGGSDVVTYPIHGMPTPR